MGSSRSSNVEVPIGLCLISPKGKPAPVSATLRYAGTDPYAVYVVFHLRRGQAATHASVSGTTCTEAPPVPSSGSHSADFAGDISWTFSRELLADGLDAPSGYGDVRIWPWNSSGRQSVALALSSPDGYALFEAPRSVVKRFLDRCYGCVPAGVEEHYIDIDTSLANLLGAPDADAR
ncbi:MAG: SsgA family sporulation/cell division regulator [Mycobacteriales bacterium]